MALSTQNQLLKNLFSSLEWQNGLQPLLKSRLDYMTQMLLQGTQEDDKVRGRIEVLGWLLVGLPQQLEEAEREPEEEPPADPAGHPYGETEDGN